MKSKAIQIRSSQVQTESGAITKSVILAVLSFLLSSAKVFGGISPFAPAFLMALPMPYSFTGLVGCVVGTFIFSSSPYTLYYITAFCTIFAIKLILTKMLHLKPKPVLLSLLSFGIMGLLTFLYSTIRVSSFFQPSLMIAEAILAGTMTYFFSICDNSFLKKKTTGIYSYIEWSSLAILFIATLTACANISILNVNMGVILGVISIFIAMNYYGILGASVASILVSIGLNLYSFEMLTFSGLLIIASFLSGAFSPLKKFAQLSVFIVVCTFGLFLLGAPLSLTYRLIEIFFATAIFIVLPKRLFSFVQAKTGSNSTTLPSTLMQTNVKTKLSFASDTIRDLQSDLLAVSKKFAEIDCNNITSVYDMAISKVCRGCSMQLGCWDKDYNEAMNALQTSGKTLKQNGKLQPYEMPRYFQESCCKLDKLTQGINQCYQAFTIKQGTRRHVTETRELVVEQFQSIADMLVEVSEEFGEISGYDTEASLAVVKAFSQIAHEPEQVICTLDKFGRMLVEIYTFLPLKISTKTIWQAVCDATGRDFDLPSITKVATKTKISLFEKATFTVDYAITQESCGSHAVCGDTCESFIDAKGYAYFILSDGMGHGKRAAIDSVMTCSLLLKLIKAGFGMESTLKLINSSLLVKSADESLATIDMVRIDLYTGKTEFLKAGAAPTYVFSKGTPFIVETGSLPVGILQTIAYDKKLAILKENDVIVMVSDGIMESENAPWLIDEIKKSSHLTAREIGAKLMYEAKQQDCKDHADDKTILTIKVNRGV